MSTHNIIRTAVRLTHLIDELPAIPSQDWVNRCTSALSIVSDRVAAISLVGTLTSNLDRLTVYSSGVELAPWAENRDESTRISISLQDRSERLNKLDLRFPDHTLERGVVAPLQALSPNWKDTPIGRMLNSTQLTDPVLQLVPIVKQEQSLCLLNILAFTNRMSAPPKDTVIPMLSATHPLLRQRAQSALWHVNNPRAWLTDREHGVLNLLIEGYSVRVIAEKLGRSSHTIHDHVKNLHKKINASSRGELIAKALGHTPDVSSAPAPEPITLGVSDGVNIAELKPQQTTARPLRS